MRILAGLSALLVLVSVSFSTASANKLVVEGGALFPMGNFGDAYNVSPQIGARFEVQKINPLGQIATASGYLVFRYSPLQVDDTPTSVVGDVDASLLHVGAGIRAASISMPFALSVGGGWTRAEVGDLDESGLELNVGLGWSAPLPAFHLGSEVRYHIAFLESDELTSVDWVLEVGLPF